MNRREFTASAGAFAGAAALPLPALGTATATTVVVPQSVYKWALLIARAQTNLSPAMLARRLHIPPQTAQAAFTALLRNGALRAGAMTSIGQTAAAPHATAKWKQAAWDHLQQTRADAETLAIPDDPAVDCGDTSEKDATDACPLKSVQESSQSR